MKAPWEEYSDPYGGGVDDPNGEDVPRTPDGALRVNIVGGALEDGPWAEYATTAPQGPAPPAAAPVETPKAQWEQLASATVNTVAGLGQGVAALPDIAATAAGAVLGGATDVQGNVYGSLADMMGLNGDKVRDTMGWAADKLRNPITIGGTIENVAPTPEDGVGYGVRLGSQFLGGAKTLPGMARIPEMLGIKNGPGFAMPKPSGSTVVDAGENAGVRVMTSDVRPPSTFIGKNAQALGERIPFVGTGGPRAAQQGERVEAVKALLRDYGADADPSLFSTASALDDVASNLAKTRGNTISKLSTAKNKVIEGIDGAVPANNAVRAIGEQITKLNGINADAYAPVVAKLKMFEEQLQSGKSLAQIEGNRKLLGDMFKDPNLASIAGDGQKALNAIYGPLREDMAAFIKTAGKDGDYVKWKNANDKLSALAGELDVGTFKNVLKSAETTPENVARLLFSRSPSDVFRLYANLDDAGRARAQAAVLQRAFDKSLSAESGLSVERFVNNIKSLGSSVGVTFKGDDLVRLDGLTKMLDATRRAAGASAAPATGVQNMPIVGGYALGSLFGAAAVPVAGAAGLFARAYESKAGRDMLLRLGRAKPGSPLEKKLSNEATGILAALFNSQDNAGIGINDNMVRTGAAAASPDERPN